MRAVGAVFLAGLAVLLAVLQVAAAVAARRQKRSYSFVPFIGALLWLAACVLAPWSQSWYAIPLLLVVDLTPAMFVVALLSGHFSDQKPRPRQSPAPEILPEHGRGAPPPDATADKQQGSSAMSNRDE